MKTGIELIAEERARQISEEGWTPAHDDTHTNGELAAAAATYAIWFWLRTYAEQIWPFSKDWLKPSSKKRNMIKAGALMAAEIDRMGRLEDTLFTQSPSDGLRAATLERHAKSLSQMLEDGDPIPNGGLQPPPNPSAV